SGVCGESRDRRGQNPLPHGRSPPGACRSRTSSRRRVPRSRRATASGPREASALAELRGAPRGRARVRGGVALLTAKHRFARSDRRPHGRTGLVGPRVEDLEDGLALGAAQLLGGLAGEAVFVVVILRVALIAFDDHARPRTEAPEAVSASVPERRMSATAARTMPAARPISSAVVPRP